MKLWWMVSGALCVALPCSAAAGEKEVIVRAIGNTLSADESGAPLGACLRRHPTGLQLEQCALGEAGAVTKSSYPRPFYSVYEGSGSFFARLPPAPMDKPTRIVWDQVAVVEEQEARFAPDGLWDKCRGIDKPDEVYVVVRVYRGRSQRHHLLAVIDGQSAAILWPQDASAVNIGEASRNVVLEFAPLSAVCAPAAAVRIKAADNQIEKLKQEKHELEVQLLKQVADTEKAVADAKAKADAASTTQELLRVLKTYVATLEDQARDLKAARQQLVDKVAALEAELAKKKELEKDQQRIAPATSAPGNATAPAAAPAAPDAPKAATPNS
jgi:hypothetical protein